MAKDKVSDILNVAGGNRELLIDLDDSTKLELGILIFFSIALGAAAGTFIASKLS